MKVYNTAISLNADFYPEAVGKLNSVDADSNALPGVSLSVDDLSYIKTGSHANSGESFALEMTLSSSGTAFAANKTLQETIDAIKAGKQIDFSLTHNEKETDVICYGFYNTGAGEVICMIAFDGTTLFSIYWVGNEDANLNTQIPMIIAGANN